VFNVTPASQVQINLTGILLRDFAEMLFDLNQDRPRGSTTLAPSALSTVGLRRASQAPTVTVSNFTGIDIHVVSSPAACATHAGFVANGTTTRLEGVQPLGANSSSPTLCLRIAASAVSAIGERHPVLSLPIHSTSTLERLFLLKPASSFIDVHPGRTELFRLLDGRASPESILSEGPYLDAAYYDAEPVVEWCLQNQRLRSTIVDAFSLSKGQDLLSSNIWSPEDDMYVDHSNLICEDLSREASVATADGPEAAAGAIQRLPLTPERAATVVSGSTQSSGSKWLRPYLKSDSPEWTDMTCKRSLARERIMLPDSKWIWVNDWNVDLNGGLGTETDADGWSYEAAFENFSSVKRHYVRGDACRRRRWTRTRMIRPPRLKDPLRQMKLVWESCKDENGCYAVTVRSHIRIRNSTASRLSFFLFSPSWDEDRLAGTAKAGTDVHVPVAYGSAVYMRLARNAGVHEPTSVFECVVTDRFSIVPTSHTSSTFTRTCMHLEDVSGTTLHFLVELKSNKGILDICIHPIIRLVNLLPCQLECQVGQVNRSVDVRSSQQNPSAPKSVTKTETITLQSGDEGAYTAINPWRKPHISLRVPGYKWSSWKRIVNRKADSTWRPSEIEEEYFFASKGDTEYSEEFKALVRFERKGKQGDPLILILSVACGHCPTLRVYSQYWIVDKTGFGCRFSEGFVDILRTVPDPDTCRRSYVLKEEAEDPDLASDMTIPGHQWSIGSSGMSLYFSRREKLTLTVETGIDQVRKKSKSSKSNWIAPLDISNVIPKTVFSVDECNGPRRFELAIHVTLCPGQFTRTMMISILPRYQIINLLHRELVIAQDGCLDAETLIPSQSSISFHWEKSSMSPQVRLGAPSPDERARGNYERCWTNGRLQLDKIGITSLRLPTTNTLVKVPMVVQAEVRLATKEQPSAVVVVVWSGSDKSNPLYMLRNRSQHTILCRQPLQDEDSELLGPEGDIGHLETCSGQANGSSPFECGADMGPMLRSFLGLDRVEEFVWILKPGSVTCFGFDDPEKPHILEWTYVNSRKSHFDKRLKKAILEVDAMGSFSLLSLPGGPQVRCQIRAEHSTKVIEFIEVGASGREDELVAIHAIDSLRQHGVHFQEMLSFDEHGKGDRADLADDDEDVSFSVRIAVPELSISVVDNADPRFYGREILLAQFEQMFLSFSQTREGYHEFEARLMGFQVDNHVEKSIHPVLVSG
jgi:SHR-binding domain of vacuolar-sorting associated protein 13